MRDQPPGGRLEGGRGQSSVEVGLVEPDDAQTPAGRLVAQPEQGELVRRGEDYEGVGGLVPLPNEVGVRDSELERSVNGLTGLRPRRQIGAGYDVQPVWALPVTHRGKHSRVVGVRDRRST